MRRLSIVLALALFASYANFAYSPSPARADAICTNFVVPTPFPIPTGGATNPICINGVLQTSGGATPVPLPTSTTSPGALLVTGTGSAGTPAPGVVTVQGIPFGYGLIVQIGGSTYTSITSASPTTCTSVEVNTTGMLAEIINTGAAQVVFLTIYDEGTSPTCAAADVIYGDGTTLTLGAGQVVTFGIPVKHGLAYKLSGAVGANVLITRNG